MNDDEDDEDEDEDEEMYRVYLRRDTRSLSKGFLHV